MIRTAPAPRVLMLSDVYFPRVNGVSTSIQTFRRDLAALDCPTMLVAPQYPTGRDDEPDIFRVRSRYLPFDPEDRIMSPRELMRICGSLIGQFNLIHIQTPFLAHRIGLRLARRLGLKTVETYHTYFEHYFHHYLPLLPRGILSRLARSISRNQCDAVDAVVAPSLQMAQALTQYGVASHIEVIPTGLDLERFSGGDGARFRAANGIEPDRPVMLTVGRIAFEKNLNFLIDVLERTCRAVPEVLMVFAGDGPAVPHLKRRIERRRLGHNVRFVGYLDRSSGLLDCYRSADVFVFASKTETQGLVLLEAMALGTPVVSTAVMGTRTVLDGAPGAVVVEEHAGRFSGAVVELLRHPGRRAALSTSASAFIAERWSSQGMARRMLDLYRRLLEPTHEIRR